MITYIYNLFSTSVVVVYSIPSSATQLKYVRAERIRLALPHSSMGIVVIQNAKPKMNATEMNAFCMPIPSIQGVIPNVIAKLMVLRINTTETMQSPPIPPAESIE